MKKIGLILLIIGFVVAGATSVSAATIGLYDLEFNIDGILSNPISGDPVPAGVDDSGFNYTNGLGMLTIALSGGGSHFVGLFVDHEIDEATNTYFNENGAAIGTAAGQSWEIDEPGYLGGDIYTNFSNSALDNSNNVPAGSEDDVSMALGWDFILDTDKTAVIDFMISTTAPGGFYLNQKDPDSLVDIYFSSTLDLEGDVPPIPEPATLLLLGTGLVGLCASQRKKLFKK
ncbi:MAG: PEP-CTERM sorting domain-containing protein [Desulfosarcina sp.]|nr:PEP-CTERM sorting domain-containing protein [Desulfosarcina sp.]MBC2741620.1 PEP-CTERM sorting domain-containing protein [Desulfosarcina sp.]MBC2764534.1 PEP-CTERM sorting domain-containing protein [Desulfosarcina sp.]